MSRSWIASRHINAYHQQFLGNTPIPQVHGRIDFQTVTALNLAFGHGQSIGVLSVPAGGFNVNNAATDAGTLAIALRQAIRRGTGTTTQPPSGNGVIQPGGGGGGGGGIVPPPPPADSGSGSGTVIAIVGAVAVGGLLWFLLKRKKNSEG